MSAVGESCQDGTVSVIAVFPPLGLRIEAGPLVLRPVSDDVIPQLAELALSGIHDSNSMPFAYPWTDAAREVLPTEFAQYHWSNRARWSQAAWSLDFAVEHEGELVGTQGIATRDYVSTRTGETGSWLALQHQGRGIGTQMRQALCAFMFDYAGASEVTSAAFTDNAKSLAVSRKVGYRPDGDVRVQRRHELAISRRLVLTPEAFVRGDAITVTGAEAFRAFIGLDS
ncbi:GNAT family N-acetyltransferase [Microbacterium sp. NC79]|uniref:GNAT family N-acetyltransferase n=1 Tax=Microbacterium sp. NC79 TaxID=2851009 RepID=UPI001C2BC7BA|nr:GNAT family protein [Microbacterium sp. NC79]MBV0894884.1 GNAT family N-acetyltransferase [Microbacterium sp. NC79]